MSFQDMLQKMTPGQGFPGQPGTGGPPADGGQGDLPPQLMQWLEMILSMLGQGAEGAVQNTGYAGAQDAAMGQMLGQGQGPPSGPPPGPRGMPAPGGGIDPETLAILEQMLGPQGAPPPGMDPSMVLPQARGQARRGGPRTY